MIVQPAVAPYGGLKLRDARDINAGYVEALPPGASVTVLEGPVVEGGEQWVRVRSASGKEGWAHMASASGEVYLAPAR
jgi:SH3-like domain-containing protein